MQEELLFIRPTKEYESQAIEYIEEFYKYNSKVNGTGGLDDYIDNYDTWLNLLEEDRTRETTEDRVPSETFMLVRKNDNCLIGMINVRFELNSKLLKWGGHIGYGIRPTERRKGYNSYQLYLALKYCKQRGMDRVLLTCNKNNVGSMKTILKYLGVLENEIRLEDGQITQRYWIDVDSALDLGDKMYIKK